jgi:hypothetical protein
MKKIIKSALYIFSGILMSLYVSAQGNEQELVVPLSNPSQPGRLIVSLNSGIIRVTGYPGKDVVIGVSTDQKEFESESRDGLKQIPNNSLGLSAREEDNVVRVNSENWNREINLSIQVPANFNLNLKGLNDGEIRVENVNGEMDVNYLNGDVTLVNVSGSAVVSSQNGDVKVSFDNIKADTPMAFSSFNGDVDVTFPAGLKATLKMRSDHGELFTDFDMNIKKSAPKVENNREDGVYKISMEDWVIGEVNGGGPEMTFKTFNGDILIRKK